MSWIKKISDQVGDAFKSVRQPLNSLPAILLLCEAYQRPGLSAIALATAIIQRLPEAGIDIGVNNDGSPNKVAQFVRIMCEEIVTEIKDNARVSCGVIPGGVNVVGSGANAAGPVAITAVNAAPVSVDGIVQ